MKKSINLLILGIFVFSLAFSFAIISDEINSEVILDATMTIEGSDRLPEEDVEDFSSALRDLSEEETRSFARDLERVSQRRDMEISELARRLENATEEEREEILRILREENLGQRISTNLRERTRNGDEITILQNRIRVRQINSEIMELRNERNEIIRTRLNLSEDDVKENLRARLSNGRDAEIKIMPGVANQRAIEQLRIRVCSEDNNCTIELKEVGNGENTRAVYEAKAQKTYKFLGLFGKPREVVTQIDAESGDEVMTTKRPWWSFLGSESK